MIRSGDLFCGAGLFSGAFNTEGVTSVFAADMNEDAVQTYNNNLHKVAIVHDVSKVIDIPSIDILVAGPPCQGFSTLGKRDPYDVRNSLSLCMPKWAKNTDAKVIVIENVPNFLESHYWERVTQELKSLGYEITTWILNAADYGAPQNRTRGFTIASKIGVPNKPKPLSKQKTVREAFDGLPLQPTMHGLDIAPKPGSLALERMLLIPEAGNRQIILNTRPDLCPPSWSKLGTAAGDVWGRMDYNKPSNTVRCCFQNASKGRYIHPTENRVITLREGARLQGVPDNWEFTGNRTSIARQIGNGVPLPLAKAVAKSIKSLF